MKRLKRLKLNTRLLVVFFTAVLLMSLGHFFVYSHLLRTMVREENIINAERMNSIQLRLDAALGQVEHVHNELLLDKIFRYTTDGAPDSYTQLEMYLTGTQYLNGIDAISGWAIYLKDCDAVVSNNGCLNRKSYENMRRNDLYSAETWLDGFSQKHYRRYFPATEFTFWGNGTQVTRTLLPLVTRSNLNENIMTVLYLDIGAICEGGDEYLEEGLYLFSGSGQLLYSADEAPVLDTLPGERSQIALDGETYAVQQRSGQTGLTYVKLLPEGKTAGILRYNFLLCLGVALIATAITAVLVPTSVNRMMDPVDKMLGMLRQHSTPKDNHTVSGACEELEQILRSREQQEAALAKRDAALSEYFLHSRLKNVYVDMERQEQKEEGIAFILYIQVHYREKSRNSFSISRAELENLLQEMMSGTLSSLFATTMVFQLEPGRFAARVTLEPGDEIVDDEMERFMHRLSQEDEFAFFTVIRSEAIQSGDDLATVYNQVQDAARQTLVRDQSQLVILPVREQPATDFEFPRQSESKLHAHICAGETLQAVMLAEQILESNLRRGISRAQMEILCVAIVNTVAHAITELTPSAEKIAATSGVYNVLTTRCSSALEYRETVTEFIRAAVVEEVQPIEDDQLLSKVQQYLRENYHREFSSEEMASALWVSRSYLSTYYKNKTGMNLSDSIQLYRIQRAVELLKDPEVKIGDIGPLVGISSSNTFLRQFRKYTGMTPKEYRLQNME